MAVKDSEALKRDFGYGAVFLRRYLKVAFPEDRPPQTSYLRRLAKLGVDDIGSGEFSRWCSGTQECDLHLMRRLFHTSEHLGDVEGGADAIIEALRFLYDNRGSLPHLEGVIKDPPPLAKVFLESFALRPAPTDNLPAIVEQVEGSSEEEEDAKANEPDEGGPTSASHARIEMDADEATAEIETDDVVAEGNASIRIKAGAGKIKTKNVHAGWAPRKKDR